MPIQALRVNWRVTDGDMGALSEMGSDEEFRRFMRGRHLPCPRASEGFAAYGRLAEALTQG